MLIYSLPSGFVFFFFNSVFSLYLSWENLDAQCAKET